MNSRSLIPVGLLGLFLSCAVGCKKDDPPKPDPSASAAQSANALGAKGKINVRGNLGPMAKIDPQAMKDYRIDICYYGTFTLRQARESYFASLGKDEPSEKKIPNFGVAAAPPTTTSASAKTGAPGAPPARPAASAAPSSALPMKTPPGASAPVAALVPDRRPLDFAMRAPHERNARACTAAAALKEPAMGDVDATVGAYSPFVVELAKDISAANNYYSKEEYKKDGFARGKELHKKLVEAFGKLDEVQDKVGAALTTWRKDHAPDAAKLDEGEREVRPVFEAATAALLTITTKTVDAAAYKANVEKLEKAIEGLRAFSTSHAADTWSKIMLGPLDAFARQAKDLKVTDKGVDADGFLGMVNGYTGLIEARQRALSRAMINKGQTVTPAGGAGLPVMTGAPPVPAPAATAAPAPTM